MRYLSSTWKSAIIRVFQFTQKLSQEQLVPKLSRDLPAREYKGVLPARVTPRAMNEDCAVRVAVLTAWSTIVPQYGLRRKLPAKKLATFASGLLGWEINAARCRNVICDGNLFLPDREPKDSPHKAHSSRDIQLWALWEAPSNPRCELPARPAWR